LAGTCGAEGGTTVIIDPELHPRHLQLNNRFTSAFWMVPSGEATGPPFPQTQNILTTRENYLFFEQFLSSLYFYPFPDPYLPIISHHFSCHIKESNLTT
jgi:hypothetical protein